MQRNLATKIRAKWEYGLTAVRLKRDPPVSEIHDNVDLVLGMKTVFELEGVIDTRDSSFKTNPCHSIQKTK